MAKKKAAAPKYESFKHPEATSPMRPDVGTQAAFKKKKPPETYRYDSSLSPALDWDGQNPAREQGEAILAQLGQQLAEVRAALGDAGLEPAFRDRLSASASECVGLIDRLKAMSRPFLNWAGKAERLSFDVPTLPLFVHERLSTKAIVQTLRGHRREQLTQGTMFDLFGDPHHSIAEQITRAYEYPDRWVNRMILGDSLMVMNSLLHFENLGGQVQMIYVDPPYGIKFGVNFQPFVQAREVTHGDDDDMTREPEMVQAYRDTWTYGIHSYLTILRDRLLLARELLNSSGSLFVQISDDNVHHVREVIDEVFGPGNFASQIAFQKTSGTTTTTIPTTCDYLLWYARDVERLKFRKLFQKQNAGSAGAVEYKRVELADGSLTPISDFIEEGRLKLPPGARIFTTDSLVSKGGDDPDIEFNWQGKRIVLSCKPNRHWKVGVEGTRSLWEKGRLLRQKGLRIYKR